MTVSTAPGTAENRTGAAARQLRGIMVGAGYFARHQLDAWVRIPEARIVAICDLDQEKARTLAADFGVPHVYPTLTAALAAEEADFVDIVTRPDAHLALVQEAAAAGKAVLCQKPLAPTWDESAAIVETAARAGVRLMVNENWRWQGWYRELRRVIAAGTLGTPFHIRFTLRTGDGWGDEPYKVQPYFRTMPRLLIYETLVHFFDTFCFLLDDEIKSIYCQARTVNPRTTGEDLALVQMSFKRGSTGLIDANRYSRPLEQGETFGIMEVEGSLARAVLGYNGEITVWPLAEPEYEHRYEIPHRGYKGDSCFGCQRHFVTCLLDNKPFEVEARDYLKIVRAVFAAYAAAARNEAVVL